MSKNLFDGLKQHFSIKGKEARSYTFVDGLSSVISGRGVLNLTEFDRWLKDTHCDDYSEDMSIGEAVRKFYGPVAENWVLKNL